MMLFNFNFVILGVHFLALPGGCSPTRPNSADQLTTMVLGTVAESRARGVMLTGRLGRLGSAPFFVGGR